MQSWELMDCGVTEFKGVFVMSFRTWLAFLFLAAALLVLVASIFLFGPTPIVFGLKGFQFTVLLYFVLTILDIGLFLTSWMLFEGKVRRLYILQVAAVFFLMSLVWYPSGISAYDLFSWREVFQCSTYQGGRSKTCRACLMPWTKGRVYQFRVVNASLGIYRLSQAHNEAISGPCLE